MKVRISGNPLNNIIDGKGPVIQKDKTQSTQTIKGSPYNYDETFKDKGKAYWGSVLKELQGGEFKDLFGDIKMPETWNKETANSLANQMQQKFKDPKYAPLVNDYMSRVDETNAYKGGNTASKGFYDGLAFFRMMNAREASPEEWAALKKDKAVNIGGKDFYFNKFKNYGQGTEEQTGLGEYLSFNNATAPSKTEGEVNPVKQDNIPLELNYSYQQGKEKTPYIKDPMSFNQIAPDLANFAAANQLYDYWTPDYIHQEIQSPTLNIQSNLNSLDSSANAMLQTTTGNPALDQARKQALLAQITDSKNSVYANKQNYDSEKKFEADGFNILGRNREMELDINAANIIHNDYVSEAKDHMTYEKMASIQNMYRKEGLHRANENYMALMSTAFNNYNFNTNKIESDPNDINFIRDQKLKKETEEKSKLLKEKANKEKADKEKAGATFGGNKNLKNLKNINLYDDMLDLDEDLILRYKK